MKMMWRIVAFLVVLVSLFFLLYTTVVVQAGNAILDRAGSSVAYGATSQSQVINIVVHGLKANATYSISLHTGSCNGALVQVFTNQMTNANGVLKKTLVVSNDITNSYIFVNVHPGNDASTATVSCIRTQIAVVTPTPLPTVHPTAVPTGFPDTGAAPAGTGSYNNFAYPLKH